MKIVHKVQTKNKNKRKKNKTKANSVHSARSDSTQQFELTWVESVPALWTGLQTTQSAPTAAAAEVIHRAVPVVRQRLHRLRGTAPRGDTPMWCSASSIMMTTLTGGHGWPRAPALSGDGWLIGKTLGGRRRPLRFSALSKGTD